MKLKSFLFPLMVVLLSGVSGAQALELGKVKDTFKLFGEDLAPRLPLTAAVGANWSDAYIGSLLGVPPHFGVGLNVGGAFIPVDGLKTLIQSFAPATAVPAYFQAGVPVPALVADARIGGLILPFDVGLKVGFLPDAVKSLVNSNSFNLDYLMYGADIRYAVIQENPLLPGVSVGAGYTYLKTTLGFRPYGGNISLGSVPYGEYNGTPADTSDDTLVTNGSLRLTDPELRANWETSVVDFKLHVDKNLVFLMPYAGVGASLGLSQAGGGLYTSLQYLKADGTTAVTDINGTPLTGSSLVTALKNAAAAADQANGTNLAGSLPDLDTQGISSLTALNAWSFRLYGGTSINIIPFTRIDLQLMYDLVGKGYGGSLGLRLQL